MAATTAIGNGGHKKSVNETEYSCCDLLAKVARAVACCFNSDTSLQMTDFSRSRSPETLSDPGSVFPSSRAMSRAPSPNGAAVSPTPSGDYGGVLHLGAVDCV